MLVLEQFSDEAIAASKLKPNATVLDVACRPGTLALRLAQQAGEIHGIDFSAAMLANFKHKIEQSRHQHIELHCGDAQTLPYTDNTFDAGFRNVVIRCVTKLFPVTTLSELWTSMLKGAHRCRC